MTRSIRPDRDDILSLGEGASDCRRTFLARNCNELTGLTAVFGARFGRISCANIYAVWVWCRDWVGLEPLWSKMRVAFLRRGAKSDPGRSGAALRCAPAWSRRLGFFCHTRSNACTYLNPLITKTTNRGQENEIAIGAGRFSGYRLDTVRASC